MVDQNVGVSRKCILTKFELSTSRRFQGISVQYPQFSVNFRVVILSAFWKTIDFWKTRLRLFEEQL